MTREALEKEATESAKKAFCIAHTHEDELIYKNGYLAGAEPREKCIEKLEGQVTRAFEVLEGKRKQIADLEKENAELKEQNKKLLESCAGATMMYEDLCEAKEIIKNLMVFAEMDDREYEKEYKEAEQFISKVEK